MNAIEVRDRSTNRADRYQLEAKIAGTVYDVGIANGADAIAGTSPGALVSASALGSAYAAMPPVEFARGTTTAIRVGNWVGSAAMGSAHVFAAVMDKHSDGQLDVIAAFEVMGKQLSNLLQFCFIGIHNLKGFKDPFRAIFRPGRFFLFAGEKVP